MLASSSYVGRSEGAQKLAFLRQSFEHEERDWKAPCISPPRATARSAIGRRPPRRDALKLKALDRKERVLRKELLATMGAQQQLGPSPGGDLSVLALPSSRSSRSRSSRSSRSRGSSTGSSSIGSSSIGGSVERHGGSGAAVEMQSRRPGSSRRQLPSASRPHSAFGRPHRQRHLSASSSPLPSYRWKGSAAHSEVSSSFAWPGGRYADHNRQHVAAVKASINNRLGVPLEFAWPISGVFGKMDPSQTRSVQSRELVRVSHEYDG